MLRHVCPCGWRDVVVANVVAGAAGASGAGVAVGAAGVLVRHKRSLLLPFGPRPVFLAPVVGFAAALDRRREGLAVRDAC